MFKDKLNIVWTTPAFKDSMAFHWCDIMNVIENGEKVPKFRVFCRKGDCKSFVEEIETGNLTEFDGRKLEGTRICMCILKGGD
jgi:hypothetical protein